MKHRTYSILLVVILLILTVSQACGPVTGIDPTVAAKEAGLTSTPTESAANVESLFKQTDKDYIHKSGAFQIPSLDGWKVNETEDGVIFSAPSSNAQVHINVTNTGKDFEHAVLEYFAFNTEDTLYVHKDNYQLLNVTSDPQTHTVTMEKSYSVDGKPFYSDSIFHQEGNAVFMVELTAQTAQWQEYSKAFPAVVQSIKYHGDKASGIPLYHSTRTYIAPENTFSFDVPVSWFPNATSTDPQTVIDTITSPDEMAVIQIVLYNNGKTWDQNQVRQAALILLIKDYTNGLGNINISASYPAKDGRRGRLDWVSPRGGYSGSTYYETRGKQLILFSLTYKTEEESLYKPLLQQIADTYAMQDSTPTPTVTP